MAASPVSVLVVDDNLMNLELASFVLLAEGFEVRTAESANLALRSIAEQPPALILMDIQMPGMSGLDLTRRLKADPATRGIVIVAFTAYAMKGDEHRLRAAGCDAYLAKPIDVKHFAQSVRACLPHSAGQVPSG